VVPVERLGITQEHARKIQLFLLNQRLARSIYSQIVLTMKMIVEVNVFVMPRHFDRFGGLTGSVVEYVILSRYHQEILQTDQPLSKQHPRYELTAYTAPLCNARTTFPIRQIVR
jgi:hypothetical protein